MSKFTLSLLAAALLAGAALLYPEVASASSPCKGLGQAECAVNANCRWMKAIVMKNGKQRKAHCRKTPTKKVI